MKPISSPPETPIQIARRLYGEAFAGTDRRSIRASMKDFEQLTPHDRLFIQCHLQYLTLCAQERTQQLLLAVRTTLEHQAGAIYAIADEVTRPAFESEVMESETEAGPDVAAGAGGDSPSESAGAGMLGEGWRSQVEATGEWTSLPPIDAEGSGARSAPLPTLSRAATAELKPEGGNDATEQA